MNIFLCLMIFITGGRSSSTWTQSNEDDYASWIGNLIVEGNEVNFEDCWQLLFFLDDPVITRIK